MQRPVFEHELGFYLRLSDVRVQEVGQYPRLCRQWEFNTRSRVTVRPVVYTITGSVRVQLRRSCRYDESPTPSSLAGLYGRDVGSHRPTEEQLSKYRPNPPHTPGESVESYGRPTPPSSVPGGPHGYLNQPVSSGLGPGHRVNDRGHFV